MNIYENAAFYPFIFLVFLALTIKTLLTIKTQTKKKSAKRHSFERRAIMNKPELRFFKMLRSELPQDWSLMCQVSYGAMLKNRDFQRFNSINSKRADFVVFNPDTSIVAIIEYQGTGHFGNSEYSRRRAEKSDEIKRQALSEAKIPFVEVPAKFKQEYVKNLAAALVGPEIASSQARAFQPAPAKGTGQGLAGDELDVPSHSEG